MDIRTSLLDPNLTAVEIGTGTESAWHFVPFEHSGAEMHALDDRYVLASSSYTRPEPACADRVAADVPA